MAYTDLCESVCVTKSCCIKPSLLIMNSFVLLSTVGHIHFPSSAVGEDKIWIKILKIFIACWLMKLSVDTVVSMFSAYIFITN